MVTKEQIREDYKIDWVQTILARDNPDEYSDWYFPDTYLEIYPKNQSDMEDIYIDQAPRLSQIYHLNINSFNTEVGIKRMESWMTYQIQNKSDYSNDDLEYMIRRNPHIHNIIKTNLISNLKCKK